MRATSRLHRSVPETILLWALFLVEKDVLGRSPTMSCREITKLQRLFESEERACESHDHRASPKLF
jgi:hypothetical protein